jgi:GTPase SAR1 family protein
VVGTTGTGKTSTVNIYTGSELQVGEGAQSVTGTTIAVEDEIHANAPKWIDNPGTDNFQIGLQTLFLSISRLVRLRWKVR